MIKVNILDKCKFCRGEAYVPEGEAVSANGERYMRYSPCGYCEGSGSQSKWVGLKEFAVLLDRAISFEPDYQELARQKPISQYQDSRECAGI